MAETVGEGPRHVAIRFVDATVERMLTTLTAARVRASVLVLPGRAQSLIGPAEAMERVRSLVIEAVRSRLESDVALGAFLAWVLRREQAGVQSVA